MKKIKKLIIIIFLSFFVANIVLLIVMKNNEKKLIYYSEIEEKKTISDIIVETTKEIQNEYNENDLLYIKKNDSNIVEYINLNTENINNLTKKIDDCIRKKFIYYNYDNKKYVNNKKNSSYYKTVYFVPFKIINTSLFNIDKRIPLIVSFIGSTNIKIDSIIKNYGVNNIYLEVYAKIEVVEKIELLKKRNVKEIKVVRKVPIIMKIIHGDISEYYIINQENALRYSK